MQPKYGSTSLCDQNCGVQSLDRQKDTGTDKSLKTEGPKILSNDIFYFRTVIIGDPIKDKCVYVENAVNNNMKILNVPFSLVEEDSCTVGQ